MKRGVQLSFAVVFLILGIVISMQFKSTQKNKEIIDVRNKSIQDVQADLIKQKEYSEGLLKEIEKYQSKIEKYEKNIDVEDMIKRDLEKSRTLAGLSDVQGQGITIILDDTKAANSLKGIVPNTEASYVTDIDLLMLLNELRAANAQAISINDERVLATTEVRKAGSFIRINNKNYNSPFTVKAIGDQNVLESSLKIRGGILEILVGSKVDITMKKDNNVFIPKYNGILDFNFLNKV